MHFVRAATSSFFPAYSLDKIPRDARGRMHDDDDEVYSPGSKPKGP